MAQMPMSASMPTPPDAGAPIDPGAETGSDSNVLVTICKNDDGTYTVYSGDEPEGGESGDMSEDDANAMGTAGDQPAPEGQSADSVGAALKLAMDILQQDASSEGAPGSAADQFAAGFSGSQQPTAAKAMPQKY